MAMACDMRLGSTKAVFGLPEVGLGLIPGYAGTQRLTRLTSLGNALKCIMSGDPFSAEEAYRLGLVQQLCEPDMLMEDALSLARKIAKRGPKAIRKVKEVIRKGRHLSFNQAMDLEKEKFSQLFEDEAKEGMKAFLEKRKPDWSNN